MVLAVKVLLIAVAALRKHIGRTWYHRKRFLVDKTAFRLGNVFEKKSFMLVVLLCSKSVSTCRENFNSYVLLLNTCGLVWDWVRRNTGSKSDSWVIL